MGTVGNAILFQYNICEGALGEKMGQKTVFLRSKVTVYLHITKAAPFRERLE